MSVDKKKLCPSQGGCYFCALDQCDAFTSEFDAYVHIACVKVLLKANDRGEASGDFIRDQEVDTVATELGLRSTT